MKDIYIFSAGSSGREIFNLIQEINSNFKQEWNVIAYVESSKNLIGKTIDGIRVIDTNNIKNKGTTFAICPIMDPNIRKNIYVNEILKLGLSTTNIIHPNVKIPKNSKIGQGSIVFNNVHISYEVNIQDYALISNFSDVGHNLSAGECLTIMPSVVIGGNCKIGNNVVLGSNSTLIQNLSIGDNNKIGSNCLITKNTEKQKSFSQINRIIERDIKNLSH